eukprot:6653059-Prymnesium_polylepis.1
MDYSGFLHKRGVLNTAFKRRWFTLNARTCELSWAVGPDSAVKGTLRMTPSTIVRTIPPTQGAGFSGARHGLTLCPPPDDIVHGGRTFVLEADTAEALAKWLRVLTDAVSKVARAEAAALLTRMEVLGGHGHRELKEWKLITPGFYHLRVAFLTSGPVPVNITTHMSLVELGKGAFVAIDCCALTAAARVELDVLTDHGRTLLAVVNTHPFHARAIGDFHALYPSSDLRGWYGCPRHLAAYPLDAQGRPIQWAGDLNEEATRRRFEPYLAMAVPDGVEFVSPQPDNHFAT